MPVPVRGYGAALYYGTLQARGRYIIMGDADDSYDFSHLTRFLRSSGTVTTSSWAILLAAGFGGALYSLARWSATGFGPLDPRVMLRAAIPAAAAMCLGGEVVLTSFFLSFLGLRRLGSPSAS